ncbi:tyrosine-type recombinase/integrase [Pseudomaricurvus alkylphenolicus]|uniref:tyrosine-type recombinase/integrase n=1 Tax=Pseudomaricurvus alkylphenolicus TaxID=1306991 RepID=UPI00141EE53B|nr:tyrosine-type recombinase/integrase [Pseudomaricurvus alkylphenolicus]NIB45131.1 tyrosine-type recombinase/integrase [Pseudomaricurvus alkylphenolicus]
MPRILLTKKVISDQLICPPGKNKIELCDTALPGLLVETRATSPGVGTFYLRYKNDQRETKYLKLGRTSEISLERARQQAKKLKAEVLTGSDPSSDRQQLKDVPTFTAFMEDRYLPYAKARKRSWTFDESMCRLRIFRVLGNFRLTEITRLQIQTFHSALLDEGLAHATCDHHLKLIRHSLNLAVEWGLLEKNPAEKIPLFRVDNRKERYMTDEEQARLLEVLDKHPNRVIALLVKFLLCTGARVNEALTATWDNVDTDNKVWRIPATNSKSKKINSKPLNQSALDILKELRELNRYHDHLFVNPRTGKPYVNVQKPWRRIRTEAGLPELRLHDLRHQFASMLVNSGRSLYEVQQILGHSDPTVTQRYAHLSSSTMQEAAETATLYPGGAPAGNAP